ncbi:MAG: carboxylesterase family protein [Terracidiphilus sp.]|jgi:para-nitrobenzyl esterase
MIFLKAVCKFGIFVFGGLLISAPIAAVAQSDRAATDSGQVKGAVLNGVVSYKGIPFAAPPIGQLRWRPPQPVAPWKGVRAATDFAPDCLQVPFPSDAAPVGAGGLSEDCLYVNVWAPAGNKAKKLPVVVWIYGGGFVNGGSSPAVYDGSRFAEDGVVFVSFNYRVGRFGFFGFPALTQENPNEPHGNYAYLDQIAALKWVQRNIAAFGGDPGKVTIEGESAGGGSVFTLLTSPLSQGLFQQAIVESGGGRESLMGPRFLSKASPSGAPSAEDVGVAFAASAGITDTGAAGLAALRALPADKVVAGLNMATMGQASKTYSGPMEDGTIVRETPQSALLGNHWAKVPVMIGANSSDIGFPRGRTMDEIFAPFGADTDKAKAAFNPEHSDNVFLVGARISSLQIMGEPARFVAATVAAQGLPSYEYRFSYVASSLRDKLTGAPHATEIPYVFDTVKAAYKDKLTPEDEKAAQSTHAYFVEFIKTGHPSPAGLPAWPPYNAATDSMIDFTLGGPVVGSDPWKARLDLVTSLANKPAIVPASPASASKASTGAVPTFTTGVWTISGDIMGYPIKETCNLNAQGNSLTGTCQGEGKAYDVTGSIDGAKIVFKHGGEYQGTALTSTFKAALSDDGVLNGSVDVDPMNVSGTFTAKKTD